MLKRTYAARTVSVCAAVLIAGSVAACGGEEGTGEPGSQPEPSASSVADSDPANAFCEGVVGIEDDLALLELTEFDDPAGVPDRVSDAAERFATIEPPEQIAASWQHVSDVLALMDESLSDVEVQTQEDIDDALAMEGEQAFTMVLRLPGQVESVGVYVQDTCQVDLGIVPPAIADVCATVDVAHLDSVFDGDVPEGENRRWGAGAVECVWDDRDDREVGIVVMPAAAMHDDLLTDLTPLDSVQLENSTIDVYDGAFGLLRAAAGHTAATVVGDTGVLASVRSGDAQAESQKAIAIAGLVADELS